MDNDTISRQAEIDALTHFTNLSWDKLKSIYPMLTVIEELPSAVRRGQWIEKRNVAFPHLLCSECKKPFYGSRSDVWNYCQNCGALMEVE